MKRPLILHVLPGLRAGGAERVLQSVAVHSTHEFQHRIVSLSDLGTIGHELVDAGLDVHSLDLQSVSQIPSAMKRLAALAGDADIVHGWLYYGAIAAFFLRTLRRSLPTLAAFHATDLNELAVNKRTRAIIGAARLASRSADAVLYCSEGARRAHSGAGFSAAKSIVVENGIDTARFHPGDLTKQAQRTVLGIAEPERPFILVPARYAPQKDHDGMLSALRALKTVSSHWHAYLCGHDVHNGNTALTALIAHHGLADDVTLMGNIKDMTPFMRAADIMLMGSAYGEALPMVVLEAMASETLVVSTDVGDIAHVLDGNGLLAPPRHADKLAGQLASALAMDTYALEHKLRNARIRVCNFFSKQQMFDGYAQIYRQLLLKSPH